MAKLAPQPPRAPLGKTASGDLVYIEPDWWKYLCLQMFNRVGGYDAPANNEISDSLILSIFEQRLPRPNDVRNGDGISIEYDAAGPVFSLDVHFVVNAVRSFLQRESPGLEDGAGDVIRMQTFLRRESPQQFRPDDANAVIAGRVFNR